MKIRVIDTSKTSVWAVTSDILPPTMVTHTLHANPLEAHKQAKENGGTVWRASLITTTTVSNWEQDIKI